LIGRNGAGKSNILRGIEWAARTITSASNTDDEIFARKDGQITIEFELTQIQLKYDLNLKTTYSFENDEPTISNEFIETLSTKETGEWKPIILRNGEKIELVSEGRKLEVSTQISAIKAVQSLLPEDDSLRKLLDKIVTFFSSIRYYPLKTDESSPTSSIIQDETYQKWVRGNANASDSVQSLQLKILNLHLTNKERFDELTSLAGENGLGLIQSISIAEFEFPVNLPDGKNGIQRSDKVYFIRYTPYGHREKAFFSFEDLSFGTKRILHFLVSLLYDSASVALVEQLEDGIHQGLLNKLISLIRSYADDSQFILASHSEAVFDTLQPHEIRIVELADGQTEVRELNAQEIGAAKSYLEADGSLSEFLQSL
jgi:predicted ATPase